MTGRRKRAEESKKIAVIDVSIMYEKKRRRHRSIDRQRASRRVGRRDSVTSIGGYFISSSSSSSHSLTDRTVRSDSDVTEQRHAIQDTAMSEYRTPVMYRCRELHDTCCTSQQQ